MRSARPQARLDQAALPIWIKWSFALQGNVRHRQRQEIQVNRSDVIMVASASVGCGRERDVFHSIALRAKKFALTLDRRRLTTWLPQKAKPARSPVDLQGQLSTANSVNWSLTCTGTVPSFGM